jgi:multiple sugar transport system permease protein
MRSFLRRRSAMDLSPRAKVIVYLILAFWTIVVLFPLYWLFVTSFKTPIQVNEGPYFLPFVDFQPTLENWEFMLIENQSDTLRPLFNTVLVGFVSAVIALVVGSLAAYALVRFRYEPRIGLIGLFIGVMI